MTEEDKKEYIDQIFEGLKKVDYIKPSDIPNIELYMDQVTTFIDDNLSSMKRHESDKLLTKTMINNYTKNNLLPPPKKKKYSKDHMMLLIFIYYFKNILSISDIQEIIMPLADRYFDGKEKLSLEDIYEEVFSMEKEAIASQTKDILRKYKQAKDLFQEEDPEQRKFLTDFAFLCALSFDVYVKKAIIERLIDDQILGGAKTAAVKKTAEKKASDRKDPEPEE